jgi:hypothetical protein
MLKHSTIYILSMRHQEKVPQSIEQLDKYAQDVIKNKNTSSIKKFVAKIKALSKRWKKALLAAVVTGTAATATLYFSPTARAKLQNIAKALKLIRKQNNIHGTSPNPKYVSLKQLVGSNEPNPNTLQTLNPAWTNDLKSVRKNYSNKLAESDDMAKRWMKLAGNRNTQIKQQKTNHQVKVNKLTEIIKSYERLSQQNRSGPMHV